MDYDGREHCGKRSIACGNSFLICAHFSPGLDDAKNTAKLAWRMMCDGCILNITKTLDQVTLEL